MELTNAIKTSRKAVQIALTGPCVCLLYGISSVSAAPLLGDRLDSFTVLGASTVTNVPTSEIVGNVGVWSGSSITGFNSAPGVAVSDPQVTGGLVHATTPEAESAQGQLTTARTNLSSLGVGTLLPADLAGLTLSPGVYTVPAGTTNLSGSMTLDGEGNVSAGWIFQMPGTLITSPDSVVDIINTGDGAGVFWNVGSSATIDVNTDFLGNILALESITFNTFATNLCGRALAATGAVTLDQNSLAGTCEGMFSGTGGLSGGLDVTSGDDGVDVVSVLSPAPVKVPEPGTLGLLSAGLLVIAGLRRRRQS
jgi:hypothetical protein